MKINNFKNSTGVQIMIHRASVYKIFGAIVSLLFIMILYAGCEDQEQTSKSMNQIQEEEGVPIKVTEITYKPFKKHLSYYAQLTGIKEATRGAIVGGKIEKINFKVGDFIKEDQVVIQFPADHLAAQYEQAKSAFEIAEKTYHRMKALLTAGETSQASFDAAETQYLVAKSNLQSAKDMIFIDAPFDGYLVDLKVNEGESVKSDAHLFTIAQLSKMKARVWITDKEISLVKKGLAAELIHNNKSYRGKVTDVSLGIDPMKQAFYADVEFVNPNLELKNGLTVEIKILVYEKNDAIIIPRNLIQSDEKGTYVFIEENRTAIKKYVTNGMDSGIDYEISKGLEKGDRLITQGSAQLDDGIKVKVIQ